MVQRHYCVLHAAADAVSKLTAYQSYIEHEKTHGDPARVQLIFERAVADNALNSDVWLSYIQYLVCAWQHVMLTVVNM